MNIPLLVSYRGITIGNGFIAEVEFCGHAIAEIEKDGAWIYGVRPGAIAEGGATIEDAHLQFRETLRRLMVDFAVEASSFDAFDAEVTRFFDQVSAESVAEWQAAVEQVRATGVGKDLLPSKPAESHTYVRVTRLTESALTPLLNKTISETSVAAPPYQQAA